MRTVELPFQLGRGNLLEKGVLSKDPREVRAQAMQASRGNTIPWQREQQMQRLRSKTKPI